MKILNERPPKKVWDGCHKHFDIDDDNTIYTYGDTLYNPAGVPVSEALIAHESTHTRQQGDNPDAWWDRYFSDPAFRCEQEVEAYAAQYRHYCKTHKDRNAQARYLFNIESALTSGMYGLTMTRTDARAAIKKRV